jgi:hypothetical protein
VQAAAASAPPAPPLPPLPAPLPPVPPSLAPPELDPHPPRLIAANGIMMTSEIASSHVDERTDALLPWQIITDLWSIVPLLS